MTKSTEVFESSLKLRPKKEYLSEYFFRKIAHVVVLVLLPTPVAPGALVMFHTCLGVFSGFLIARGHFLLAAGLIQIKTVLDNADGQLARARRSVTEIGRYGDTEGDFFVNLSLFIGIAFATDRWLLSAVAFVIFSGLLSLDFNWEYLYRHERNEHFRPDPDSTSERQAILKVLRWLYRVIFAPQDRGIRRFSDARFERIFRRNPAPDRRIAARLEYYESFSLLILANLELSTQLLLLGICLALGVPEVFLWTTITSFFVCAALQIRRERIATRVLCQTPLS